MPFNGSLYFAPKKYTTNFTNYIISIFFCKFFNLTFDKLLFAIFVILLAFSRHGNPVRNRL